VAFNVAEGFYPSDRFVVRTWRQRECLCGFYCTLRIVWCVKFESSVIYRELKFLTSSPSQLLARAPALFRWVNAMPLHLALHASRLETPTEPRTLNSHSSGTRWTRPQRRGRGRQQAHRLGLPYMRGVPQVRGLQQRRGQRRRQSQGQRLQRALQLGLQQRQSQKQGLQQGQGQKQRPGRRRRH
jgi:hypothetical protein